MKRSLIAFLCAMTVLPLAPLAGSSKQNDTRTLAEKLGYQRDAKLLIVHADDVGVTHSVNAATIKAFETGLVNSGSIMVPCPWFPEIAAYARTHPEADLGLHLTLTSERPFYRWGPVISRDRVPTLVDREGYFQQNWADTTRINPREAEAEIRAQIERAYALGIQPTHLDAHQGKLYQSKKLFAVLLRVAHKHKLPVVIAKAWFGKWPYIESSLGPNDLVIDRDLAIKPEVPSEHWAAFYTDALRHLPPGVTELRIHPGYDDEEMRAFASDRPTWGAEWRQRDFDFFTSSEFQRLLQENNIKLITWREIGKLVVKSQ